MAAKPEDYLKNDKWVGRVKGVFVILDKNKKGYLSQEDFTIMADRLAEAVPDRPEEVAKLRKVIIQDYCTALGITEGVKVNNDDKFMQQVAVFVAKEMNAHMKGEETVIAKIDNAMLDVLDQNHDGTVSFDEYKAVTAAAGFDSEETARASFDMLDKNKNGKIERKECIEANFKFWCNLEDTVDELFGAEL